MQKKIEIQNDDPSNNKSKFEGETPISIIFRSLSSTKDGILLLALIAIFLLIGFKPSLIYETTGVLCNFNDSITQYSIFFLMPLALIAEYFWFSAGTTIGKTSWLRIAVLLSLSALPFLKFCTR